MNDWIITEYMLTLCCKKMLSPKINISLFATKINSTSVPVDVSG
jgi:hypothetical protein